MCRVRFGSNGYLTLVKLFILTFSLYRESLRFFKVKVNNLNPSEAGTFPRGNYANGRT